jgi:glucokinase
VTDPSERRLVGVDVGGTKCLGIAIGADGEQYGELRRDTPSDADELVATIVAIARELDADGHVGIGVPGLVTRDGVLLAAPNVTGVRNLALRRRVEETSGLVARVDNDNTVACLAEWTFGAARGVDDVLLVGIGTGIGGGFVCGGELQRGANGFAGEFGHMIVVPDGIPCPCGQRGCWERYASGTALETLSGKDRGEEVTAGARAGDAHALEVIEEFAGWVALGLANLTNLFDPAMIVLAGGISADADLFLPRIQAALDARLWGSSLRPHPRVGFAALGPRAGAIGAALLCRP